MPRTDPNGNTLPHRMHHKHGAYYRVFKNKWQPLTSEYASSLREWAHLEGATQNAKTVAEGVEAFMVERGPELAEKTRTGYESSSNRILSVYGVCHLRGGVTRPDIAKYLRLKAAAVSANRDIAFFSSVYSFCMEQGWADDNPCKGVRRKRERARRRTASEEDLLALANAATPTWKGLLATAIITGMREGELRALKRTDITRDGVLVDRTKTGARSVITWSSELWNGLCFAVKQPGGEYVFSTREGEQYTLSGFSSYWRRLTKRAGVTGLQFRDLRRTAASEASSLAHASALLGHGSTGITKRVYRVRDVVEPTR